MVFSKIFVRFQTDDGEDDLKKGTQLLEIYALEIQMYTVQKNNKKLKALYEQSLHIKSAIPHPLIMGVIRGMFFHFVASSFILQRNLNIFYRMRWKDAFARRWIRKSAHGFLWSVQKLRWKWISTTNNVLKIFGFGKYVSYIDWNF